DDNLFGWAAAAVVQEVVLSAEHKKIRDAVENHRRDVKYTLHNLLHTGLAPVFPEALWKKILLDQVVDFDEINAFFFSTKLDLDPTPVSTVESALHKALGRSAEKKTVSSSVVWFRCFDKYVKAVETIFPYRTNELRAWREHIDDLFTSKVEDSHARVIAYDIAARKVIGSNPAILFNQSRNSSELSSTETAFGTMILEAQVGAQNLREQNLAKKREREICNNWNEGKCFRSACSRRHVCSSCEGPHVVTLCKPKSS
ncbi:hypothetical protein BDZ89DRAFT_939683, partial [Hymenopellis radicata]